MRRVAERSDRCSEYQDTPWRIGRIPGDEDGTGMRNAGAAASSSGLSLIWCLSAQAT